MPVREEKIEGHEVQCLDYPKVGLIKDVILEKGCTGELMILLRFNIVCREAGIHQASNGKDHEHD